MHDLRVAGLDWLIERVEDMTDSVERLTPVEFNEKYRYLSPAVTSIPGYIRYDVNPFMAEILNCADVHSPTREVNLMKGAQITYSTLLDSIFLYYAFHIKTLPMMYLTADKEMALARMETNFIPMINDSGFAGMLKSLDIFSTRKTGKTKDRMSWEGGGYIMPFGAKNADKMRQWSIAVMLKDEIDGYPLTVGQDGDPDKLTDARLKGYWENRKIFRGSTPLIKGSSKIEKNFLLGDQRRYFVKCKHCRKEQYLRWHGKNKEENHTYGIKWNMTSDGVLDLDSVRYECKHCGQPHFEHDKERLFSAKYGAQWKPTAQPSQPEIRSYHLPALYSPIGMAPWYSLVADYLEAVEVDENHAFKVVKDMEKYRVFQNNVLAATFTERGDKIRFQNVSGHRRVEYAKGQVPNKYAAKHARSKVLFLTCTVDVQKRFLSVAIIGWTRDSGSFLVDYFNLDAESDYDECTEIGSSVWAKLTEVIEERRWKGDDGEEYGVLITLIDASYTQPTVVRFCSTYEAGVYPIIGRDRPGKHVRIKEFDEWTTNAGTVGYKVVVDHYKDRMGPVLRRYWVEEMGEQKEYHFNAPYDVTDKQIEELTKETRRKKVDAAGNETYYWHRPNNARNELWDLLVYGHASVEIYAYNLCIQYFELDTIDWPRFWDYMEEQRAQANKIV